MHTVNIILIFIYFLVILYIFSNNKNINNIFIIIPIYIFTELLL